MTAWNKAGWQPCRCENILYHSKNKSNDDDSCPPNIMSPDCPTGPQKYKLASVTLGGCKPTPEASVFGDISPCLVILKLFFLFRYSHSYSMSICDSMLSFIKHAFIMLFWECLSSSLWIWPVMDDYEQYLLACIHV